MGGWSLPGATPAKVESIPLNSGVDRAVRPPARTGPRVTGTSYGVGMQPPPPVLEAVLGDITTQHVDAIVNAANAALLGGGGVDGAIHRAAGPALLEECREVRRTAYPHGLPVGAAVTTGAGRLPARWVIHTVGPNRHAGETDPGLLAACYASCLAQAVAVGARSLAFPAVSAGAYGWSPGDVADIAVSAVRASPHVDQVNLVRFVLFGRTTLDAFAAALA
jgi:O-acetyl-ADP-ribose deacetylase